MGLAARLDGIVWMVTEALGVAMTTFSAQNFGARNYERMRRVYHVSLVIKVGVIGSMALLLLAFVDNTSGAIRGSGESLRPMLLTVIGTVVFRVAWLLVVVPLHHTLQTMLLVYPVTWILTAALFVAYHHFGHWLAHAETRRDRLELDI